MKIKTLFKIIFCAGDVAIPQGASKSQVEAIQKAIEYGKNNGVQVNIHVIQ